MEIKLKDRTLYVDGRQIGSRGHAPPSGWVQRVYGIQLPADYEVHRLSHRYRIWTRK